MKKRRFLATITVFFMLMFTACQTNTSDTKIADTSTTVDYSSDNASTYEADATYDVIVAVNKVGKADGMVIKTENHTVVIDCGEQSDGSKMRKCLAALGVETIDYMILTHYDQDHIGGAAKVLKYFDVEHVIGADYEHAESKEYLKLIAALEDKDMSLEYLTEKQSIVLDDAEFLLFPCESDSYIEGDGDKDNNHSIVVKMYHHNNVFLFTADAQNERLAEIMDIGDCDWLKEPCHGRELEHLDEFLDAVTPEIAVISTSEEYLADSTVKALEERNIETYITFQDGNMQFTSNGSDIQVETGIEYPSVSGNDEAEDAE